MVLKSYAKINLTLEVIKKLRNGLHDIQSIFCLIDLSDKIRFYAHNDKLRKKIAMNGKKKYFKLFNEKRITEYFIKISTGKNFRLF